MYGSITHVQFAWQVIYVRVIVGKLQVGTIKTSSKLNQYLFPLANNNSIES